MSSKPRKRSRASTDENRADCPFSVTTLLTPTKDDAHKPKKRKHNEPEDDSKPQLQTSPFTPTGKFKTQSSMDVYYAVEPRKRWLGMTRYNSFVLNGIKYFSDNYVHIANDATIERQKAGDPVSPTTLNKSNEYWVARILEIRATDEFHVYARVFWMYSPDELPPNTIDGKKTVSGRQPYHGQHELIASNHMDIINVVSVAMHANVNHWIETDEDEVQNAMYWRQAFDCRTLQLSAVETTCKCDRPANPDKVLIGCTKNTCGKWLHEECLLHDVLMRVYKLLGRDKPHVSDKAAVKEEGDSALNGENGANTLGTLNPAGVNGEQKQTTIAVRGGSSVDNLPSKTVKDEGQETPKSSETPTPGPVSAKPSPAKATMKRGRGRKSGSKPYEGLFDAELKMNLGPTVWLITDLREGVKGGDRTWTEPAHCLLCNTMISNYTKLGK